MQSSLEFLSIRILPQHRPCQIFLFYLYMVFSLWYLPLGLVCYMRLLVLRWIYSATHWIRRSKHLELTPQFSSEFSCSVLRNKLTFFDSLGNNSTTNQLKPNPPIQKKTTVSIRALSLGHNFLRLMRYEHTRCFRCNPEKNMTF